MSIGAVSLRSLDAYNADVSAAPAPWRVINLRVLTPSSRFVQIARTMPDESSSSGQARRFPRLTPVQAGLLVSVCVLAVILGAIKIWSGGDDGHVASATPADKRPVKVVITSTERAKEEVTDGGIQGLGIFKASGAITDRGTVTTYRGLTGPNESVILLRFVTKGRQGGITYMVKIDTTRRPVRPRWWIQSGTGEYKGLQGRGDESENETYTVSTLTGRVWH